MTGVFSAYDFLTPGNRFTLYEYATKIPVRKGYHKAMPFRLPVQYLFLITGSGIWLMIK